MTHTPNGFGNFYGNLILSPIINITNHSAILTVNYNNVEAKDLDIEVFMASSLGHVLPDRLVFHDGVDGDNDFGFHNVIFLLLAIFLYEYY